MIAAAANRRGSSLKPNKAGTDCPSRRPTLSEADLSYFSAKNLLADVRPEFLEDVIQDSGFHLRFPAHGRLTEAALLRRMQQFSWG
jgi:hypothetical protein